MMKRENPREFYYKLEGRLSPILRTVLLDVLPQIGGKRWWKNCVKAALSPIQLDNLRNEETLEQFDYPALVSIFYKNWRSIKYKLGVGDELVNYLFSIKTLRNEVEHQPDLVLSLERKKHLEQAVSLAEQLLIKGDGHKIRPRVKYINVLLFTFAVTCLLLSVFFFIRYEIPTSNLASPRVVHKSVISDLYFDRGSAEKGKLSSKDCSTLYYIIVNSRQYMDIVDIDRLFFDEIDRFRQGCLDESNYDDITEEQVLLLDLDIKKRIDRALALAEFPSHGYIAEADARLRMIFKIFKEKGIIDDGTYEDNRDKVLLEVNRIKKELNYPEGDFVPEAVVKYVTNKL